MESDLPFGGRDSETGGIPSFNADRFRRARTRRPRGALGPPLT
ncbi:MAG: hypothetical protein AB1428_10440 [Bacteroidota bacterium]